MSELLSFLGMLVALGGVALVAWRHQKNLEWEINYEAKLRDERSELRKNLGRKGVVS